MWVSRLIKRILLVLLPAAALVFCFMLYGPAAAEKSICISEVCLNNLRTLADPSGNYTPYVELHNPSGYRVNLERFFLATESFEFPMPAVTLSPGEYRVFFLNGCLDEEGSLPLRISEDEPLFLYTPGRELLSQVFLKETPDDMSLGGVWSSRPRGEYVLQQPTPGEENRYVFPPELSIPSGYYAEDQVLEITCATPNTSLYYTLDGSDPTVESTLYEGPINLTDASKNPNVYSINPEISTGYMDMAKEYDIESSWPGYVLPEEPVEKCNVVKVIAVNDQGETSEITEGDYFVGISRPKIPVMELTIDPEGLFSEETGIYVKGEDFAEYAARGEFSALWKWWSANYFERGFEWEREGRASLFRLHEPVISHPTGVRIKGQTSRAMAQKSLNLNFRRMYGEKYARGMGVSAKDKDPRELTLFNGADSFGKSGLKDYLVQSLCAELNFGTTAMQPLRVYLDGEYWGFYYLTEKIGSNYIEANYSIEPENLIMIKNAPDNLEAGEPGDEALYQQLLDYAAANDLSKEEYYNAFCEMVDMDSLLDYYAVQCYIARTDDWPSTNFALWRTKDKEEGEFGDNKWRYLLFDSNSDCIDSSLTDHDSILEIIGSDYLIPYLVRNAEFRERFAEALRRIETEVLSPERVDAFIDQYKADYLSELELSCKRYFGDEAVSEVEEDIENIRSFFDHRPEYMEEFIKTRLEEWE